jgi:hypothetical protein
LINEEQRLVVPWMVLPPEESKHLCTLLVSAPDGEIIKLLIRPKTAEQLGDILTKADLWQTVFVGLVTSLEMSDG